jgi:predicted transport protein
VPPGAKRLIFARVDPDTVQTEAGFTRDVRKIGHLGTGDLEIGITSASDFEKASLSSTERTTSPDR